MSLRNCSVRYGRFLIVRAWMWNRGQVLDSALTVSEFLSQSVVNGVGDYGQGHLVGVSRLGWLSWSGWIFHF